KHWTDFWKTMENKRWSQESKECYTQLKRRLKYHLFEKKDGAIINQIIRDNGTLSKNQTEVDEDLAQTIEEIQIDLNLPFLEERPFKPLPILETNEMITNLKSLSSNKALTLDAFSDIILKSTHLKKTAEIFRDIWSTKLETIKGIEAYFTSRLIPLNKVFPETPTRKEMRPILIGSPLQKILESRFLPHLNKYQEEKMFTGQTGFVKQMGTQVNIFRAVDRIRLRTEERNQICYGLFIDFANAFNSVPHKLLFDCLRRKQVMPEDHIEFLENLYAHYRIRIGKKIIRVNKGVAQGSILSPALFNIFIEDLAKEIIKEAEINIEDALLYADDILTICTSPEQIRKVINIIEKWSQTNGMELNKKKSGIMPFVPRRATSQKTPFMHYVATQGKENKQWKVAQQSFEGIPILLQYKYLGTILDFKLRMDAQLQKIEKKSNFIYFKLYPYLASASADARRDMWITMVSPLFNVIYANFNTEDSKTALNRASIVWKKSFKLFMLLPKVTDSKTVKEMIAIDLEERIQETAKEAREKWMVRRKWKEYEKDRIFEKTTHNPLRGIPNDFICLIRLQFRICKECKAQGLKIITSAEHLRVKHNLEIKNYKELWEEIKEHYEAKLKEADGKKREERSKILKRKNFRNYWNERIREKKEEIEQKLR
ncbi:MAG TPA: reverse transcriptase family protein, partial [Candidatus Dojkabacteria bacterium]|nr:reverse transcriptase family protein [Candidatus Dojkabacteria bacterium]